MKLYHYTCVDHGDRAIQRDGLLRPGLHLMLRRRLLWLTDLDCPIREGLGLTSDMIRCDRTAVRYTVEVDTAPLVWWWPSYARQKKVRASLRDDLERYGLPAHWWVTEESLPFVARVEMAAA